MIKPIEKALLKIPNRFLLTTVVAQRWENLVAGAPPLVETPGGASRIETVFKEIVSGHVVFNPEDGTIELHGQPQVEENDEPIFSEAIPANSEGVRGAAD